MVLVPLVVEVLVSLLEVELEDDVSLLEEVDKPIGAVSVVLIAASEVADAYAELAAEGLESSTIRTRSII